VESLSSDQRKLLRQGALGLGLAAVVVLVGGWLLVLSFFSGSEHFARTDYGLVRTVTSEGEGGGHMIWARAGQKVSIRVVITKLEKATLTVYLTRNGFPLRTVKHEMVREAGKFSWKVPAVEGGLYNLKFIPSVDGSVVFDAQWKVES
jgi:hypothetical protein